jgi:hypothetical protein
METSAVFKIFRVNSLSQVEPKLPDDEEGGDSFCGNCLFWEKDEAEESIGECHRNVPQVIALPDQDGQLIPVSVFPATEVDQWCGEHQEE